MIKGIANKKLRSKSKQEDIYASASFVAPLIGRMKSIIPFNQYSIRPFVLAILANEFMLNSRKEYLEFGAGISTVLLSKFAEINDLPVKITAVEHDKSWISLLKEVLKKENLEKYVSFIYSPLRDTESPFGMTSWYDSGSLLKELEGKQFDLAFVDAPPGKGGYHRYNALPFLINNALLTKSFSLYLDDAGRKQEARILAKWQKEYKIQFEILLGHLGAFVPPDSMKVKLSN
jgi:hypothetical protein